MTPQDVLSFWFEDAAKSPEALRRRGAVWFHSDPAFDRECAARFAATLEDAARGSLDAWAGTPRGRLALVIVLDQMPRNIHRGSPAAFMHDAGAAAHCLAGIESGQDRALHPVERLFLYMPLQHAEDLDLQRRSVERFESLAAEADDACGPTSPGTRATHTSITTSSNGSAASRIEIVSSAGRPPMRSCVTWPPERRRSASDEGGIDVSQEPAPQKARASCSSTRGSWRKTATPGSRLRPHRRLGAGAPPDTPAGAS